MASFWDRYRTARASRRAVLKGMGATAAAAAALAAGCGESDPKHASLGTPVSDISLDVLNPAGRPRSGGRFATAAAANFGTFDPHLGIALASAYFPRVYNMLVNQSATKPEFFFFDLAESLEQPDDQTYIFKLRPGVRIGPNGLGVPERDMDGEDVRVTLERIGTEPTTNNHSFARQYIESVTVQGDLVTVKTPVPYAWFMNRIGLFVNAIAPRELLAGDVSRLTTRAAGAGPFRLLSLTEGEGARFDRNPNYYRRDNANGDAQLPYVDGIDLRVIFDRAAMRAAFLAKQLHSYMPSSGGEAKSLGEDFTLARDPAYGYISFTMNPKRPPFDDPRARRAFARAIDRRLYVDVVYQGDAQPNGLVSWPLGAYALPQHELEETYQPYDVQEAKSLVRELGGLKVKMMYPAGVTIEEHEDHLPLFLEQMKKADIEIEQDPQDFSTWIENYLTLNYDCSLALNQLYETPELPLDFHTARGPLGDGSYVVGLGDLEIETAVRKAKETLDLEARIEAVHAAQKLIYEKDPMMLPLVSPFQFEAYWDFVKNITGGIGTSRYLVNTFWLDL